MGIVFNADELLAMAERIETNGETFYRGAAARLGGDSGRILTDLADWEVKHRTTFGSMRAQLGAKDREATAFDPDDEAALYLQAMADSVVFVSGEDALAELGPAPAMGDVLQAALRREKDTIAFFAGMREMVPPTLGKGKIDAIIREEMGHVTIITRRLNALAS